MFELYCTNSDDVEEEVARAASGATRAAKTEPLVSRVILRVSWLIVIWLFICYFIVWKSYKYIVMTVLLMQDLYSV